MYARPGITASLRVFFSYKAVTGLTSVSGIVLFFLLLFPMFDFSFLHFLGKKTAFTTGRITGIRATSTTVNEERVMAVSYRFVLNGRHYSGTSFGTVATHPRPTHAKIEYVAADPSLHRIKGLGNGAVPPLFLLFMSIPLVMGIIGIITWVIPAWKKFRMVRTGQLVRGTLLGVRTTGTEINDVPVMEGRVVYSVNGTEYTASGKSVGGRGLEENGQFWVLYQPRRPGRAVLVNTLPPAVRRILLNGLPQEADTTTPGFSL